jgi:hypothetical protein
MEKPKLHKCPECGRVKGAELLYGMPSEEAWKFIDEGLLISMGCMPPEGGEVRYDFHCTACGHDFNEA